MTRQTDQFRRSVGVLGLIIAVMVPAMFVARRAAAQETAVTRIDLPINRAYPYRADFPGANALGTADELAGELDRAFEAAGPGTVAAFVAEPIVGATLAAVEPPDGYWPAIAEVCRRHGVLLIADEVMTGFGRTGRWFGLEHYGVQPDIMQFAKGITSGYVPLGGVGISDRVREVVENVPPQKR